MIQFDIQILKQFNGTYNYFNPSGNNFRLLFRREFNYDNIVLLSDIVDQHDNIIFKHYFDENFCYSYEDARLINENECSLSVCIRPLNNLNQIKEVQFKKYNFITRTFTNFSNNKNLVEKNWQFYNDDKIIYQICPYVIVNKNEDIVYSQDINFNGWIEKYGCPRLSTNVFTVDSKHYLLFHSNIKYLDYLKYFIGILRVEKDSCIPINYLKTPLIESSMIYSCPSILFNMWKWRNTQFSSAIKYEVIFPMNVITDDENINIYSGINDCSAGIITIKKSEFLEKINL